MRAALGGPGVLWDAPLTKDVHIALCLMAVYPTRPADAGKASRPAEFSNEWPF